LSAAAAREATVAAVLGAALGAGAAILLLVALGALAAAVADRLRS